MKTKHIISIAAAVAGAVGAFCYLRSRTSSRNKIAMAGDQVKEGGKMIRKVMHHAKEELH